jgi:hypothetical protein
MNWNVCVIAVVFACALPVKARAQAEAPLSVTRGRGAGDCPDAEELARKVDVIRGSPAPATHAGYRVGFAREGERFVAEIRASSGRGVRRLYATGQRCSALAKATAVTLALLLDSQLLREDGAEPRELPPVRSTSAAPGQGPAPRRAESTPRDVTFSLGGAAVFGVLRPLAPGLLGDAGLRVRGLRTSLGALWLPSIDSELGPGTVTTSLLSGTVRGCFVAWPSDSLELGACTGALIGVVSAEGAGYTENERSSEPWIAVPFEISLLHMVRPVGWEISAAALVVLRRYEFAVDGLGVAYRSLPFGVMLSLRGYGFWAW